MSRTPRFFVHDLSAERIELPAEEAHHVIHVLRMSEGMPLALFDGKGRAASGEILRIEAENVTVRALSPILSRESELSLVVGVAVPKGDRMAFVVQKLTELGVHRIVPLLADRGEVGKAAVGRNLTRWRRVALESCKQSSRSAIPEITEPKTLEEIFFTHDGVSWMAHPGAEPAPGSLDRDANVLALVGPEGGWSDRELQLAAAANVTPVGLGPRTLRTETAAVVLAGLLQWIAGDLSS